MPRSPTLTLVATVVLAACGSEEARVPPVATEIAPAEPACVPPGDHHARICALAPPHRRVQGGRAYKVATIGGEGFWVVLPDELAPAAGVVAVPGVPLRHRAHLTTASARDAADRACDGLPTCEPVVVEREAVPAGVLTRWDDASGTIRDLAVTTLDFGLWTLVVADLDTTGRR